MEKEKSIKNGTKKILYTGKEIYTDSLRTLHEKFNATRIDGASLSEFNSYKPFYVSKPTETHWKGKRDMPVYSLVKSTPFSKINQ